MGKVPEKVKKKVQDYFKEISTLSFNMYSELNKDGVARELARALLPVNLYTEWYWKNDLHNLLHFVGLRSDSHAQYEIRVFSDAMAYYVKENCPLAWEAYHDYVIKGMKFSKIEQNLLGKNLPDRVLDDILEDVAYQLTVSLNQNKKRDEDDLYQLYLKQGGKDSNDDFKLKWSTGGIDVGNIRELREFKNKLIQLKPDNN